MPAAAHQSSLPPRRDWSGVWQGTAVLLPLLLLTVLGWRGILASREEAFEEARGQAQVRLEWNLSYLAASWGKLLQTVPEVRLYPDPPPPAPRSEAQARYAEAVALAATDSHRAVAALSRLAMETPDALAASGVPLSPLARWRCVQWETDPGRLRARVAELVDDALTHHPSVLTPNLLASALSLLPARGVDPAPWADWPQHWHDDERARAAWRRHEREIATHQGRWLEIIEDTNVWWVHTHEDGDRLTARIFPWEKANSLEQKLTALLQPLLPDYARPVFSLDGQAFPWPFGENPLPLTDRRLAGDLGVELFLIHNNPFYDRQVRQTLWLAALLASALAASLAGFWTMRRALFRERQLGELKSNFVASVSHELRAPLAAVRLLAENLESDAVTTSARRREYHAFIAEECRRLSALIDNVLDFARIEQNRRPYDLAETDAPALVADAVQLLRPHAAQRRQEILLDVQPLDPPPVCDGLAVRQALVNLLDNAVKFAPVETTIHVRLAPHAAASWQVSVRDEGPGIPPTEHATIFERFHRLGSELRRETQGAGIGLSIVRHIAQAHGGRVEIASQLGAGATFTLILPLLPSTTTKAP